MCVYVPRGECICVNVCVVLCYKKSIKRYIFKSDKYTFGLFFQFKKYAQRKLISGPVPVQTVVKD
jgi:hypothetical protein